MVRDQGRSETREMLDGDGQMGRIVQQNMAHHVLDTPYSSWCDDPVNDPGNRMALLSASKSTSALLYTHDWR